MSGDSGGFGPSGPAAGAAAPFAVSGPSELKVDASRSGATSFTVSNVTGRPARARMFVVPGAGADAAWFTVAAEGAQLPPGGESPTLEQTLSVAGTASVRVTVKVPDQAPPGPATFVLGVALEEAPDQVVSGPTVAFQVPAPVKKRFPWWIVIVAVIALLVLAGGGILIWSLTRGGPEPTPTQTPTPTGPAILIEDDFIADADKNVDLDADDRPDIFVSDTDFGAPFPAGLPTMLSGIARGVAIVEEPTFDTCRDVVLESSVQIPAAADGVFVCVFTSGGHAGVLEFGATEPDEARKVHVIVWD